MKCTMIIVNNTVLCTLKLLRDQILYILTTRKQLCGLIEVGAKCYNSTNIALYKYNRLNSFNLHITT